MYRHRGRTVGTFIIGAIVVIAVIYAAFGRLGSSTMPTPHVKAQLGTAETSQQSTPGHDLAINPTTEECKKGWETAVKLTKEQFEQLCAQMQAAK
jgi:hypothetical protein